ncbi:MAG: DUF4097 domain-containing protein [Acidobacteriota bacterium]|nr:DUF4097 domain-containing protein [Acidobacteriota bacterium]
MGKTARHTAALILLLTVVLLTSAALAADNRKESKYNVGQGAIVTIANANGPITVKSGGGRQVLIVTTTHSDKVEVDAAQSGNRIESRAHSTQRISGDEGRVDYEVTVPADVDVTIRGGSGAIHVERLRSDIQLESDSGNVDVRDAGNGHVHVRTVTGPVTLTNISNGHIEITTVSGDIALKSVTGPHLNVNAGKGNTSYDGDFGSGGDYVITSNSGNIDVRVPANASIALKARSINGSVENDLPLQASAMHMNLGGSPADSKRTLMGTSNSGSSSVELRSFSGKIRVKKQ